MQQHELATELLDTLTSRIAGELRGAVAAVVEREIHAGLTRLLAEGEFHRRLGRELQEGLKGIYRELSQVRRETAGDAATGELLSEATDQLDQVLKTTERATVEIMEIAERHMDQAASAQARLQELAGMVDGPAAELVAGLAAGNAGLSADLMQIMTALSFQDLTGQRIGRIFAALRRVEALTVDLVVHAGVKLQAKAQHPDLDPAEIEAVAQERASDLKGPQAAASQENIDALLAQMGM